MKSLKYSLLLALVLFVFMVSVVYGQDDPVPPNPQDLVSAVVALVAAVAALVSNFLINLIKTLPGLSDENKSKLTVALTEIIAVVVSIITGYVTALVAQGLGLVDDVGIRAVVVAALTPVFAELRYRLAKLQPVQAKPYR